MTRLLLLLALVLCGCGKPDASPTDRPSGVFDPAGLGPRDAPPVGPQPDAEVVDYGPRGGDGALQHVGQVFIGFSQPMVPFGSAADQASDELRVSAAGAPVAGRAYWQTPDRLVFEAEGSLPPAHAYDVVWAGRAETAELAWSFETGRPTVAMIEPVDRGTLVGREDAIYLRTNLATPLAELAPRVAVRVNGRDVPVRVRAATQAEHDEFDLGSTTVVVVEHAAFEVGAKVEVDVRPGWRSDAGPLPSSELVTATYDVHPKLEVTHTTCDGTPACDMRPIELEFSTPVPRDQLRHIQVSPRPPQMEMIEQWDDPAMGARIEGRFVPGQVYRVTVDADLTDAFGQRLGRSQDFAVEFEMPPAELYLRAGAGNVLDDGAAHIGVSSRHVERIRVRVAKVSLERYRELYFAGQWSPEKIPAPDEVGETTEHTLAVRAIAPTEWGSTPLDIARIVGSHRGPVVVEVSAVRATNGYEDAVAGLTDRGVFVVGSLAPIAFTSTARSFLRVENLTTGRAAPHVDVALYSSTSKRELGATDIGGLLEFEGRAATPTHDIVVARDAATGDVGIAPLDQLASPSTASWLDRGESIQGELVAERGVYRPGDDLFVAGWSVVRTPHNPWGQRVVPDGVTATVDLIGVDGISVATAKAPVTRGRFWAKLAIPKSARLGRLEVRASFARGTVSARDELRTTARVEEFRTPTFEVLSRPSSTEVVGDEPLQIEIDSRYLSGTRAPIESARAQQTCWSADVPQVAGWSLGMDAYYYGGTLGVRPTVEDTGLGAARVRLSGLGAADGRTLRCSVTTTVRNKSYQEEGAVAQFVVHPSPRYIGVAEQESVPAGTAIRIEPALFDVRGKRAPPGGEVADFTLTRHTSTPVYSSRGRNRWVSHWDEKETVVKRCRIAFAAPRCRSAKLEPGQYVIEGQSRTDSRRRFRASFDVEEVPPTVPLLTIEGPHDEITPGAMTAVTVRTKSRHGTLIVGRHGILQAIPFETTRGIATVPLATSGAWAPAMRVEAWVIHRGEDLPRLESAHATIAIDASDRALDVEVRAPATAVVREEVTIELQARSNGMPVDGRAVVWAVDDAILGLTNYSVPDLVRAFYPQVRPGDIQVVDTLVATLPRFVPELYDPFTTVMHGFGSGSGFGGGGVGRAGAGAQPRVDFRATPLYLGDVAVTGGQASVTFHLPDSMTRFRVLAVVSADLTGHEVPARFGVSDATITVGAPLVLRPALPRFIRPGDRAELAAIVQNASGKAGQLEVRMALDGDSIDWVTGVSADYRGPIGVDEELRVGFDARAVAPGDTTVTLRTRLVPTDGSPPFEDAVRLPLRSESEPTLTETVATYGTLDGAAARLALKPPGQVHPGIGGVSVTVTSTILGGLRDATAQLINYPYGCAEQTASRMLPLVALAGLTGFADAIEIPDGKTLAEFVDAGIARLVSMQTDSGGFSYWPGGTLPHPYVSAYVTWVLYLAEQAGHAVPNGSLERALAYLETVVAPPGEDAPDSVIYYGDLRRAIAVHVLAETGRKPRAAIDRLLGQPELPVFAKAFVIAAVAKVNPSDPRLAELLRQLLNTITQTPGSASVVETPRYDLGPAFHSDLRSSAIASMALTRAQPDHPVIAKLARGLMEKRYRGAWRNTQENAYALVALADYARVFESTEPNFHLEASTDHAVLISSQWRGRSSYERVGRLPMEEFLTLSGRSPGGTLPLRLDKKGDGRAYYRLAMTYAPSAESLPAIGRGIDVVRTFRRDGVAAATTAPVRVNAGEVIAIDVDVQTRSLLRYVAVNVPVPAGFEPINLTLGSAKALPMGGASGWWVSHTEYHDDRVLVFADVLQPGPHRHTVYVRATTPGTYTFPPTRAEAMYTPEVFGRTVAAPITID